MCYPGLGFKQVTERSYAFNYWAETAEHESMSKREKPGSISPSHLLIRKRELDERPDTSPPYAAHIGILL